MKTRTEFVHDVRRRASVKSEASKHALAGFAALVLTIAAVSFSVALINATPGWDHDEWYEIVGIILCWVIGSVAWVVSVVKTTDAFTSRKARR